MKLEKCICCGIEMGLVDFELEGTEQRCEECVDYDRKPGYEHDPFKELARFYFKALRAAKQIA